MSKWPLNDCSCQPATKTHQAIRLRTKQSDGSGAKQKHSAPPTATSHTPEQSLGVSNHHARLGLWGKMSGDIKSLKRTVKSSVSFSLNSNQTECLFLPRHFSFVLSLFGCDFRV
jgi:hypothetical protein